MTSIIKLKCDYCMKQWAITKDKHLCPECTTKKCAWEHIKK